MRNPAFVLIGVLLVLGLVAVLLRPSGRHSDLGGPLAGHESGVEQGATELVQPSGDVDEFGQRSVALDDHGTTVSATPNAAACWMIRGVVQGPARQWTLKLTPASSRTPTLAATVRVSTDAAGSFEADLENLAPYLSQGDGVDIALVDDSYGSDRLVAHPYEFEPSENGCLVASVELHATAKRVVTGTVLGPGEQPIEGALVASYVWSDAEGRAGEPQFLGTTYTESSGRFELPTSAIGTPVYVLACAERMRPSAHPVFERPSIDIHLTEGESISGSVRGSRPGVRVQVSPYFQHGLIVCADTTFAWRGADQVELAGRFGRTDEAGRFVFTGLAPEQYFLSEQGHSDACQLPDSVDATIVTAPAVDVVIEQAPAVLRLEIVSSDGVVGRAMVLAHLPTGELRCYSSPEGTALFRVKTDTEYQFTIRKDGFLDAALAVRSSGAGTELVETVTLVREPEPGTLVLSVRSEDGAPVTRVGLGFVRNDAGTGPDHQVIKNSESPTGVHEISLPAGSFKAVIHPDGEWDSYRSYLIEDTFEFALLPGERRTLDRVLEVGGRCTLRVQGPDGEVIDARCRIIDEAQLEVETRFWALMPDLNQSYRDEETPLPSWAPSNVLADVRPSLRPGPYTAIVERSGLADEQRSFTIGRGQETAVVIQLAK